MNFKDVVLEEFNIVGFIDFESHEHNNTTRENIEFGSWGEDEDKICPYCGEEHNVHKHNELNWEDLYPTHSLLKKNLSLILKDEDNIEIRDKKYEIIKFSENINEDSPGYNLVGLRVKDLNKIPPHLVGMRFPKRHYKSVTISMEDFMNSEDLEKQIYENSELDDYFIIEYDLYNKVEYNRLIITIYYPVKE